jgi:LacI family repressor for deo operon, udp, cdd, tsx, nupC, and nupG
MVAFGLIAGLQAGGLSVPGDISVIGFDDIDMSEYYVPSLTTIRQDRNRLGREAADALLARLGPDAPGAGAGETLIDLSLVVRDSTAPPP